MSETQPTDSERMFAEGLKSVSPSRYGALRSWKEGRTCALQLLWRGKAHLAPYPAAKLGDVVHRMFDRLPTGADEAQAKEAWDEAISHTEELLREDWVTRGLLPLSETVKEYTLKKIRTIRGVLRNVPSCQTMASGPGGGDPSSYREDWLESADGLLKGRADLIERRDGKWVLVDYKSGSIHEDDEESGGQRIKDEYKLQLQLYAHLIRESKGITVSKALLRTLDGVEHEVEVDEANVQSAGTEARSLLSEFNSEVQRHEDPFDLAMPMPNSWEQKIFGCAGCLFRPLCPSYHGFEKTCDPDDSWPNDAWGKVVSTERMEGKVKLRILNRNRVVGPEGAISNPELELNLADSTDRHPHLAEIKVGGNIRVYDFLMPRMRACGEDGPRTCVYAGEP